MSQAGPGGPTPVRVWAGPSSTSIEVYHVTVQPAGGASGTQAGTGITVMIPADLGGSDSEGGMVLVRLASLSGSAPTPQLRIARQAAPARAASCSGPPGPRPGPPQPTEGGMVLVRLASLSGSAPIPLLRIARQAAPAGDTPDLQFAAESVEGPARGRNSLSRSGVRAGSRQRGNGAGTVNF